MIGLKFFENWYSKSDNLTIFDLGAHHGNGIREALKLFPASTVHAFEPSVKNFFILSKDFINCQFVRLNNCLISDGLKKVIFFENNYDATHSIFPINECVINTFADASDFKEVSRRYVESSTIEHYCLENGIEKIHILKIDVQGGELKALEGARGLLKNQAIDCIFLEVEFRSLYQGQPLFVDIYEFLKSYGYEFVNFVNPKISAAGVMIWSDAVFVSSDKWAIISESHKAGIPINSINFSNY